MSRQRKTFGSIEAWVELDRDELRFEVCQRFGSTRCGFRGTGAAWCWNFQLFDSGDHNPHFCELDEVVEALQWVGVKRLELVEGAE